MRRNLRTTILIAALALAATTAFAAEGRTPIWEPTVITQSGRYIVTRDIPGGPGVTIEIAANGVDLDLNGFVVGGGASPDPVILAAGVNDIAVHNGIVSNGSDGLFFDQIKNLRVERLQVLGPGAAGNGIVLKDVTDFTVRNNQVRDHNGVCISIGAGAVFPTVSGIVDDNQAEACDVGIDIAQGSSLQVRNNRVEGMNDVGIRMTECQAPIVAGNTVNRTGSDGILLEQNFGAHVRDNTVHRALGGPGIHLSGTSGALVVENLVTQCDGDGMTIDGEYNQIQGNTLSLNGLSGTGVGLMLLGPDNHITGNSGKGNNGPAIACAVVTADFCDASGAFSTTGDSYMPAAL